MGVCTSHIWRTGNAGGTGGGGWTGGATGRLRRYGWCRLCPNARRATLGRTASEPFLEPFGAAARRAVLVTNPPACR